MKKMIKAFTTDVTDLPIDKFLKLIAEPQRRAAVGVDCEYHIDWMIDWHVVILCRI
jgi:hypothetical protein